MEKNRYIKVATDDTEESGMLENNFDAVVMLTWSDWHKEMRSNRYHYAKRFSRHLPVIFVQPDIEEGYRYEPTELKGVTILHVAMSFGCKQTDALNEALREKGVIRPLLWIYNFLFVDFIATRFSPFKVYHATEDYFCKDFYPSDFGLDKLKKTLKHCDLLVAVSDGVKESYCGAGRYKGESVVITNGCDFSFLVENSGNLKQNYTDDSKIVLYQGGISFKVDFQLLIEVASRMPDWEFWFCGAEMMDSLESGEGWESLLSLRNCKYLGNLKVDELKEHMYQSSVGIIPFVQNDWIIERSFPLKAFEYVACGLPVVSVPIKSLLHYPEVIQFAQSAEEFIEEIIKAAPTRYEPEAINKRLDISRKQDYDDKFQSLCTYMGSLLSRPKNIDGKALNILILYDSNSIHVTTLKEHLESFSLYSHNNIFFANATEDIKLNDKTTSEIDISIFDAIVIHYSVRLSLNSHLSQSFADKLRFYGGLKILFIQDEYDNTDTALDWIEDLGIQVVFTCVPAEYVNRVYPSERFRNVEFIQTLTGYVPLQLKRTSSQKPHSKRKYEIGYRGRQLPYWYGLLGQEKLLIGQKMREICNERGIIANIEWEHDKRIYGEGWYEFIEDCIAMLGTESGSNIFDFDGDLSRTIEKALEENPGLTFDDVFENYLKEHEGKVMMNQISPKIFEAISLHTALVLFEGSYSDVIKPDLHFIPLKKDFSNVDDVLKKLRDHAYLEELTRRAYSDIIESGKYSYKKFINDFDTFISQKVNRSKDIELISSVSVLHYPERDELWPCNVSLFWSRPINISHIRVEDSVSGIYSGLSYISSFLPHAIRKRINPLIKPVVKSLLSKLGI
jgi:hypothetical protein